VERLDAFLARNAFPRSTTVAGKRLWRKADVLRWFDAQQRLQAAKAARRP
jgi:hypothetical protein